jgi:transposase InsO family protein
LATYLAIKKLIEENKGYSVSDLCKLGKVSRAAYYKWANRVDSPNDILNKTIADKITSMHAEHPDMGYRRLRDALEHDEDIYVNDKRVLRICREKKIQSIVKGKHNCCTKPATDPAYVAENILNREFDAQKPNEKWVTDVTEFKYGVGTENTGKIYLSAIIDLCDKRPVSYVISDHNDNPLVFDTFDAAVKENPDAHPLFHSDRGYQYTSNDFRQRIIKERMTQSMSRVARCIDNGPMEGFWGVMKREMYYTKKYQTKDELIDAIHKYINYYTNRRVQRKLNVLTPMEYHEKMMLAA